MNRKVGKAPFTVRTIAALLVIYGVLMCAVTVVCAMKYQAMALETVRKQAEEIASDLRGCAGVNTKSRESKNGFQTAQAAAVMRYHRFMKKQELKKMGVDFDASFYRAEKDEQGNVRSLREVLPETPVLLSAPFSKKSPIIVFADTFNSHQMALLEQMLAKGDQYRIDTYIEDAEGYEEGRFFLPSKITVGRTADGEKEITIKTGYRDDSKKKVKKSFQDIQVTGPGDRTIGTLDGSESKASRIRSNYENRELDARMAHGSNTHNGWIKAEMNGSIPSRSDNYVLQYGAELKPMAYVASHFKKLYLAAGVIVLLLGAILIGGHNKALERRFENEESRRRMMDAMAHELKTPLGILKNYGEMLLEEDDREKGRLYAETMIQEADAMNHVVVSMLDLSKMEAGTYPLELSSLSVTELAKGAAERMEILTRKKALKLELNTEEAPRILADEKLVNNILSNFMANAISHAEEGSSITVEVKPEGQGVLISVHNQGEPVSEKDMKQIWNSFYRSDSSRSRRDGGSGLGLAIVRNACLLHGGTYGCSNERGGVTFWARIPSLEKRLARTALQTGPVLNVTGRGYRLKGLIPAAIGLILQGLFSYTLYIGAFSAIFKTDDGSGYICILPFSVAEACGALAGWLLALAGLVRVHRKGLNLKPILGAVSAACILTVLTGAECIRIWLTVSPVEEPTLLLILLECLLFAAAVTAGLLLFWKFRQIARDCRDQDFGRRFGWKFWAYAVSCGIFVLLCATRIIWDLIGYMMYCPVWLLISVFAAYGCLQACRRFNGREPVEG